MSPATGPKQSLISLLPPDHLSSSTFLSATRALALGGGAGAVTGAITSWKLRTAWSDAVAIAGRRAALYGGMTSLGVMGTLTLAKARGIQDHWNVAFGAGIAGVISGVMKNSMHVVAFRGAGFALVCGALSYYQTRAESFWADYAHKDDAIPSPSAAEFLRGRLFAHPPTDPYRERAEKLQATRE